MISRAIKGAAWAVALCLACLLGMWCAWPYEAHGVETSLQPSAVSQGAVLMRGSSVLQRYDTIQAAVDGAVYRHGQNSSQTTYAIRLDADFTLASGEAVTVNDAGIDITIQSGAAQRTITRGYAGDALFTVTAGTLEFANVTVDGAKGSFGGGNYGGLVYASGSASAVVLNAGAVFQNSSSGGQGGAAYVRDGASFTMKSGSIGQNCYAPNGGFASIHNNSSAASFISTGAILRNNEARAAGGALFVRGSNVRLGAHTAVYGNTAGGNGWAISADTSHYAASAIAVFDSVSIVDNGPRSGGSNTGGGVYLNTGSTITLSGKAIISSNRGADGTKANVVVGDASQIIVSSAGFDVNSDTGLPAARVGVRMVMPGGSVSVSGDFATSQINGAAGSEYLAFQNDENALLTGWPSGANGVQWAQYVPVCKIEHNGVTYAYPTITDAMADANTLFGDASVTIKMLVANYDFRFEFYYPETIIEEDSGSTVPRNYQGVICSNPHGVTIAKASASDSVWPYRGGDAACVLNRNLTYTIYNNNESIDVFGSMFRVRGAAGAPSTLTFDGVVLDGSWDRGHYGRYGSFVFVTGNNRLVLDNGAVMRNAHVAPIDTAHGYYQTRSGDGGAINVRPGGSVEFRNGSLVQNCSASRNGGGVYACEGATVSMSYTGGDLVGDRAGEVNAARNAGKVCSIIDCAAGVGGAGAGNGGAVCTEADATIDFSGYWEVDRNSASGDGGSLYIGESSTVRLSGYNDDLARIGYSQAVNGGGAYVSANTTVTMSGESCALENHATTGNGGGFYLAEGARLDLTGEGATTRSGKEAYVSRNYCEAGGNGGGVYASDGASVRLGASTELSMNGYPYSGSGSFDPADAADASRITTANGGGLYAANNVSLMLENESRVRLNGANANGGGVYLGNGGTLEALGTATLTNNHATSRGGGVYANGATVNMGVGTAVSGNRAGFTGGGVHLDYSTGVFAGVIADNGPYAEGWFGGGGVCSDYSTSYVTGAISGNAASDGAGMLLGNDSKARLSQEASVSGNTASGAGGGVCIYASGTVKPVLQLFGAASVTQNTAGTVGGGVLVQEGASLVVAGSVGVDGNTSAQSTAAGHADNVRLPATSATNAAGNATSERVQVVADPTSGVQGLSTYAHVGVYSDTEEEAYEQFGEARVLDADGWYASTANPASQRTYLHRFFNDRDASLYGTYGVNDEVVWGVGLRVYKHVTGAYANLDKQFDFQFAFSGDSVGPGTPGAGSAAVSYQVFRAQADGTYVAEAAVQLSEGDRTVNASLGEGDYIQFNGVYGDKMIRVSETDSLVSASGQATSGRPYVVTYDTANDYGVDATAEYIDVRAIPNSSLADDDGWRGRTYVTAQNALDAVPQTGMLDNVLPWCALLVAVALLLTPAAFFGARRRQGGRTMRILLGESDDGR